MRPVERVVLNALAKIRGFAAGYLRLRRINGHRLEDESIHLFECRSHRDAPYRKTRLLLACLRIICNYAV